MTTVRAPSKPASRKRAIRWSDTIRVVGAACIASGLTFALGTAAAEAYPDKSITLIVPFAPGASADGIARIVGRELSTALGQSVIVDNRPGGGGSTGLLAVARAAPDGYVIGLGATGAIAVNPHLPDAAPLDPQKQLAPIAKLADIPLVFVASTKSGYRTLQDFIGAAQSTPDGISYGTTGQYTSQHLAGELLASMSKATMVAVPYRGSGPAVTDLLGGQLAVAVVDLTSASPHIKAGSLRPLAVTSATRSRLLADVPTVAESGIADYAASGWMGLFAPAATPAAVRERLSRSVKAILDKPEVQQQIVNLSAEPSYLDAVAFHSYIAAESGKWNKVISAILKPK